MADTDERQFTEAKDAGEGDGGLRNLWLAEIRRARSRDDREKWLKSGRKIQELYRDDRRDGDTQRFNVLHAITEILSAALYQRQPVPDVRARFQDQLDREMDQAAKDVAMLLERALSFSLDQHDFDAVIKAALRDYLLPGLGLVRVRYVPTTATRKAKLYIDEMDVAEREKGGQTVQRDDEGAAFVEADPFDEVVYEEVKCEYVPWTDFLEDELPDWDRKRWIAFRHRFTRKQLVDRFGDEKGRKIQLDEEASADDRRNADPARQSVWRRAECWEIWDRETRRVIWVSEFYQGGTLMVDTDPLRLAGFWPVPRPLKWATTCDTVIPVPPYKAYEDQAADLDELTCRISALTRELKRRGVYDAEFKNELARLASGADNEFVPIERYQGLHEKGGLERVFAEVSIDGMAKVLDGLYRQFEQLKQQIYEITGIADIVRGSTQPSETLGAQSLKAQFATLRIAPKVAEVARFARDILDLKAEIMAEHFSAETLHLLTGIQVNPTMQTMLQNDAPRAFRVDIETESTLTTDQETEQQQRTEFLRMTTEFVATWAPLVQAGLVPIELPKKLLQFGVRPFKVGRELEEAIEMLGQPPVPQPGTGAAAGQGGVTAQPGAAPAQPNGGMPPGMAELAAMMPGQPVQ